MRLVHMNWVRCLKQPFMQTQFQNTFNERFWLRFWKTLWTLIFSKKRPSYKQNVLGADHLTFEGGGVEISEKNSYKAFTVKEKHWPVRKKNSCTNQFFHPHPLKSQMVHPLFEEHVCHNQRLKNLPHIWPHFVWVARQRRKSKPRNSVSLYLKCNRPTVIFVASLPDKCNLKQISK